MAGFADLPIGDGSIFASTPTQPQQPQPSSGGGGLGGFLYKNFIAPTVNAVSALPGDVVHAGEALGTVGSSILSGHHGAQLAADKQKALDQVRGTTAGKSLPSTVAGVKAQPAGQQFEQIAGNTGKQILDASAPLVGGGELAGKVGLKALTTAGAKMGAKFGAAGGAANAMSQGQGAEQVAGAAGSGGLLGAGAGAAGGVVGAAVGRLAGKTTGASSNSGLLSGAAAKAGERSAMADKTTQAVDFAGADKSDIEGTMGYDKGGNPIGITQVSSFMRGLKLPANAHNMQATHDFLTGAIGGNLKDITDNVPVSVTNPTSIAEATIRKNSDTLGRVNDNGSGVAADTLNHVKQATEGLTEGAPVSAVLDAISELERSRENIGQSIAMGKTVPKGQDNVYKSVIDSLHKSLDSAGVNKAVTNFKVTPELEQAIHADAAQTGVPPEMSQHVIDTLNNASSYGDLRSAMQPGVVAGKLARVAKETFANQVPKEGKTTTPGVPSWEIAASLHNPAYLAAAGAKLAGKSGAVDAGLSKVNPGAFNAGREAALAPDEVTAQKLAQPGGGPATSSEVAPPTVPSAPSGAGLTGSLQKMGIPVTAMATGQAANQAGQAQATSTPVPGGLDTASIDQAAQQPAAPTGPTSDGSNIPGGTLQDLQAEVQADPKNASVYEQIYADAQKQIAANGPQKLNATQAKNLTNIQNATAALHNYVSGLNGLASSTRGAGVGHLSALMGKFGLGGTDATGAASLEAAKPELAIQLAQAMNNGQKAPQGLTKEIEGMLPSVGDSKALAEQKIQRIAENLSSYLKIATTASTSDRTSGDTSSVLQALGIGASSGAGQ